MGEESKFLALYLDAPLQSWGYQSRFERRTSLSYPTRSGVIGMICAALGRDWGDTEILQYLDDLKMTVLVLKLDGRLVDYHTVGCGYDDDKRKQERWNIPRTADGTGHRQVQTYREYLENAKFGVVFEGPADKLAEIECAMQNPKWGIWLGRKSCIPAEPVYQGLFEKEEDAMAKLRECSGCENALRVVRESAFTTGTDTLMDRPINFKTRKFVSRRVTVE